MKFEYYKGTDGWRWRLVARNGKIIASGEAYRRKKDCLAAIELIRASAEARVVQVDG